MEKRNPLPIFQSLLSIPGIVILLGMLFPTGVPALDPGPDAKSKGPLSAGRGVDVLRLDVDPPFGNATCIPDGAEDDDTRNQAFPISPDHNHGRSICPVGDQDWSTFRLDATSEIDLEIFGTPGDDTVMALYDATGNQIERNDDHDGSRFSVIDRTCDVDPLKAGRYFVQIYDFNNNDEIESYNLNFLASSCLCDEATRLCLNDSRFVVEATWGTLNDSGVGVPVSLTNDTGYFWFFNSDNIEVVVKILDGCSFNGHFWIFAAGLTDTEVYLTVTDTLSGETWNAVNLLGTPFQTIQDTSAFMTCP